MAKRPTLGERPPAPKETTQRQATQVAKRQSRKKAPKKDTHERVTVYLPIDLSERMRDLVYWRPDLTLSGLVEEAIQREVDRHGEVKPRGTGKLTPGRPPKGPQ